MASEVTGALSLSEDEEQRLVRELVEDFLRFFDEVTRRAAFILSVSVGLSPEEVRDVAAAVWPEVSPEDWDAALDKMRRLPFVRRRGSSLGDDRSRLLDAGAGLPERGAGRLLQGA